MRKHLTQARLLGALLVPLLLTLACEQMKSPPPMTVEKCFSGQLLSGFHGQLVCRSRPSSMIALPRCNKYSDALTSNGMFLRCINLNNEGSEIRSALNNLEGGERLLDSYATRLFPFQLSLGSARPGRYCGQTANPTNAALADGTATGVAAAASLCAKVPSCGSGARMCTVYDMYQNLASKAITEAQEISKSWVYMASWSQEFSDNSGLAKEPGAGLADNCGGYTVLDSAKKWYGTAMQWTTANSGKKALKFFSGPASIGVPGTSSMIANPGAVSCASVLPIACCKEGRS